MTNEEIMERTRKRMNRNGQEVTIHLGKVIKPPFPAFVHYERDTIDYDSQYPFLVVKIPHYWETRDGVRIHRIANALEEMKAVEKAIVDRQQDEIERMEYITKGWRITFVNPCYLKYTTNKRKTRAATIRMAERECSAKAERECSAKVDTPDTADSINLARPIASERDFRRILDELFLGAGLKIVWCTWDRYLNLK